MLTRDVLEYFGSKMAAARRLEVTRQAIQGWGELVPLRRAWQIEDLTSGKLKVKIALYRPKNGRAV